MSVGDVKHCINNTQLRRRTSPTLAAKQCQEATQSVLSNQGSCAAELRVEAVRLRNHKWEMAIYGTSWLC
jgi:hypothetical protein